ncbi:hypothetical protein [Komarekiella delphini-convector]|uniref:hypothetical protein n=1 Tax=Komarekiella delphini-convector TaxID=3050158 RepID=UPI001CD83D72|nr:hypothetical protein [Komarekiella delphini-convector]
MPGSQLLPKQKQVVDKYLATNAPTPLLIERVGGRTEPKYKPGHLPCNTNGTKKSSKLCSIMITGIYAINESRSSSDRDFL